MQTRNRSETFGNPNPKPAPRSPARLTSLHSKAKRNNTVNSRSPSCDRIKFPVRSTISLLFQINSSTNKTNSWHQILFRWCVSASESILPYELLSNLYKTFQCVNKCFYFYSVNPCLQLKKIQPFMVIFAVSREAKTENMQPMPISNTYPAVALTSWFTGCSQPGKNMWNIFCIDKPSSAKNQNVSPIRKYFQITNK